MLFILNIGEELEGTGVRLQLNCTTSGIEVTYARVGHAETDDRLSILYTCQHPNGTQVRCTKESISSRKSLFTRCGFRSSGRVIKCWLEPQLINMVQSPFLAATGLSMELCAFSMLVTHPMNLLVDLNSPNPGQNQSHAM